MADPDVTVVVCTYRGAATLGNCLAALARQTVAERAEVVVVVDGSGDASEEIAERAGARLVVHATNRGLSAARNSGIAAARAPIVAFTDDDCVPTDRWLERLLLAYDRPGVAGVGGGVGTARVETAVHRYLAAHNPLAPLELDLDRSDSLPYRLWLYLRRMWAQPGPGDPRAVRSFPGANMSFRRDLLEEVGGFDPAMRFGADDEYICARLRAARPDLALWFEPAAEVLHDYDGTLADVWRRNFAYGEGHARDFLGDPAARWPIVFPGPLLVAGAALVARKPSRALALVLGLCLLYPQGLRGALSERRARNLVFSLMRLVEEGAHDAGMAAGLARGRGARRRRERT